MTPKDKFLEHYLQMRVNCNKPFNKDNPEHVEHLNLWWSNLKTKDIEIVCRAFKTLQENYTALVLPRLGHILDAYKEHDKRLHKPLPKVVDKSPRNKELGDKVLTDLLETFKGK